MSDIPDDKLETLLRHAAPRAAPDAAEVAQARAAVHADWRAATRRSGGRRAAVKFALAASVLLVVAAGVFGVRTVTFEAPMVAAIDRSFGSIHILGRGSSLAATDDLQHLTQGQTILTGDSSGLALAWSSGGSLRIDENSEIELAGPSDIILHRGRIYFDSTPAAAIAGHSTSASGALRVETEYGSVTHVGTQYMVAVEERKLSITVREGVVEVDGRYYDETVVRGKQAEFDGRRRPVVLDVNTYGQAWNWVSNTSPPAVIDGRSINEFLEWVSRELGYQVEYATDAVRNKAVIDSLRGLENVSLPPTQALQTGMSLTGFSWYVDGGVIYVEDTE
ncbi:MAG: FecR family protein [Pseudomonadota bacterium]